MSALDDDLDTLEAAITFFTQSMARHRMWEHITSRAGVSLDKAGAIILQVLTADAPRHCRLHDIAEQLGIEAPSVTRKVQQLEQAGLVKRHADPADKRAALLAITPLGRKVLHKIRHAKREHLAAVLATWPPKERHQLVRLVDKLYRDIAVVPQIPVIRK